MEVGSNARQFTVTGLSHEQTYVFRLTARTAVGWGEEQEALVVTTERRGEGHTYMPKLLSALLSYISLLLSTANDVFDQLMFYLDHILKNNSTVKSDRNHVEKHGRTYKGPHPQSYHLHQIFLSYFLFYYPKRS